VRRSTGSSSISGIYALANGLELKDETDTAAFAATRCVPRSSRLVTAVVSADAYSSLVPCQHLHTNLSAGLTR
jgi:hypothetical protein